MIISFSGLKGVGKDTVVKIFQIISNNPHFTDEAVEKFISRPSLNPSWEHKKWAGIPNKIFKIVTGINYSNLPRDEKEVYRPTFIDFADNHMKNCFGNNVWVNVLLREYNNKNWLISDTRLQVEFDAIKKLGGITIYVSRSDVQLGENPHRTETELIGSEFDYYLSLIPGDIDDTIKMVRVLIEVIENDHGINILNYG